MKWQELNDLMYEAYEEALRATEGEVDLYEYRVVTKQDGVVRDKNVTGVTFDHDERIIRIH
jgi:hypothetical protein